MNNKVNIIFSSDNNYASTLAVALQSIINNSNAKRNYDVVILSDIIEKSSISLLKSIILDNPNFNLEIIEAYKFKEKFNNIFVDRHLSIATYYRFLLPSILKNYEKVLYLDTDIIAIDDVAKLYDIELEDKLLAGCADQAINNCDFGDFTISHNLLKKLNYKKKNYYVNAGVLLFNLKKMRDLNISEKLLNMAFSHKFPFHDQDVINLICDGDIKILDERWNFTTHLSPEIYPKTVVDAMWQRIETRDIGIIHYPGTNKPWKKINSLLANEWWKTAFQTPFYCYFIHDLNKSYLPPKKIGKVHRISLKIKEKLRNIL